jgi:uncharacterized lipoprotein YddW (UPF0748 family)
MKLKSYYFISCIFTVFLFLNSQSAIAQSCFSHPEFCRDTPKRDLRGVYLASISNLNWPTNRNATPDAQQAELVAILDKLQSNGYNTVFLQIRPECDALYKSSIEPWSYFLTGKQGLAPSVDWDPLAFAITEAHKRGLDLHAWINPFRAKQGTAIALAKNHVAVLHPEWIINSGALKMLNPGLPEVRNYLISIIEDISIRYDIDGIHFDDYFYPYSGMSKEKPQDAKTFADKNPKNISTIEDWRRENVNQLIAGVYDAIQEVNIKCNKNIVFGISPFGIWKSGAPAGISGNSSYFNQYCDPIAWLNAGKIDYLAPQLYWKINGSQDYLALSKWWNDQVNARGKQLYLSNSYYRMVGNGNWSAQEIQNQIRHNRATSMNATFGQIAYSYSMIKENVKGINHTLATSEYKYKSFAPPISGKDSILPNKPTAIRIEGTKLKWEVPKPAADGEIPVKYVVYAFDDSNQALTNKEDGSKIIDIIAGTELNLPQNLIASKYFVVTSLDRNNNESGDFTQLVSHVKFNNVPTRIYPNSYKDHFALAVKKMQASKKQVSLVDFSKHKKTFSKEDFIRDLNKLKSKGIKKGFYADEFAFSTEIAISKSFKQ